MNPPDYQTVPITCPNCNNRFVSPVMTIVDATQNPEAKTLFLSGQINVAVCPQCGHAGMLSSPIVYHDAEKELFLTYIPSELGLPDAEQQRIVGDLTNRVMSSLPVEQRKGYLLRPHNFLQLTAMIEAILEADGITPEMLEAQRAKATLLERLVRSTDEDTRRLIAQENSQQIDYEFFQILTLNIELAQSEGQEEIVRQLLALRAQLLKWTEAGQEIAAREEVIRELGTGITREALLDKLIDAALAGERVKIETMVAVGRSAIDYVFYQQLTERIDAAQDAGNTGQAETLKALRESILTLVAEIDAEIQKATEQTARLIQEMVESDDLENAIRAHLNEVDDMFLSVLAMNLQAAVQAGRSEEAERLNQIGDTLMKLIEESQPPEILFINQLLSTEYPEGTQALLVENRQLVNPQLLELMQLVGQDLADNGRHKVAQRLAQIREQAAAMIA